MHAQTLLPTPSARDTRDRPFGGWRLILLALLLMPILVQAASVTVVVKQSAIRAGAAFHSKPLKSVSFGDSLTVQKEQKNWFKVESGGVIGWIHGSAVSDGGNSSDSDGVASALGALAGKSNKQGKGKKFSEDEVALAGKGFNQDVEGQYRNSNPSANFAAVDRMEKLNPSARDMASFFSDGGLQPRDGSNVSGDSPPARVNKQSAKPASAPPPPNPTQPEQEKTEGSNPFGSFMEKAGGLF